MRAALLVGAAGLLLGLLLGLLPAACSDDTSAPDAAAADKGAGQEAGRTGDGKAGGDGQTGDGKAGGDGAATTCSPDGGGCRGGLQCLCCGSIGPKPICLCSKACNGDDDCGLVPGQPLCNAPTGSKVGICTPLAFNCCWHCK